jgi:hypothetical protein
VPRWGFWRPLPEATVSSPDPAAADAAVLQRLRAGDEAAFEALVAVTTPRCSPSRRPT